MPCIRFNRLLAWLVSFSWLYKQWSLNKVHARGFSYTVSEAFIHKANNTAEYMKWGSREKGSTFSTFIWAKMDITGRSYICMWDTFSLFVGLSFLFCLFVCFFKCVCFSKMKLPAITTREGHSNISKAEISCSSAAVHATERVRPTIEMQLADNSQQHKELSISVAHCKNHCSSSLLGNLKEQIIEFCPQGGSMYLPHCRLCQQQVHQC